MTHRITVSLPDDLYEHVQRIARASRQSEASVIRGACADLLPRTTKVLDFIGTEPRVTPDDVAAVDAWGEALKRFLETAPEALRPMIEGLGGLTDAESDD